MPWLRFRFKVCSHQQLQQLTKFLFNPNLIMKTWRWKYARFHKRVIGHLNLLVLHLILNFLINRERHCGDFHYQNMFLCRCNLLNRKSALDYRFTIVYVSSFYLIGTVFSLPPIVVLIFFLLFSTWFTFKRCKVGCIFKWNFKWNVAKLWPNDHYCKSMMSLINSLNNVALVLNWA